MEQEWSVVEEGAKAGPLRRKPARIGLAVWLTRTEAVLARGKLRNRFNLLHRGGRIEGFAGFCIRC
jgi:hypothetical protein